MPAPSQLRASLEAMERQAGSLAWRKLGQAAGELLQDRTLSAEAAAALRSLERGARRLCAWQELRRAVAQPWQPPPDPEAVRRALGRLEAEGSKAPANRLRIYLTCRAHLEGQPRLAQQLAGEERPGGEAASLLRDLKATTKGPTQPRPTEAGEPSVLGPLVPEAPAMSFRPAVREALSADLPTLTQVAAAEKQARTQVLREVEDGARIDWHRAQIQLHRLLPYQRGDRRPATATPAARDPTADPTAAEMTRLLGRKLSPGQLALAGHLRLKRSSKEVAEILRGLDAPAEGR